MAVQFSNLNNTPLFQENGPFIILDGDATIENAATDDGAVLSLERHGGANADDILNGERLTRDKFSIFFFLNRHWELRAGWRQACHHLQFRRDQAGGRSGHRDPDLCRRQRHSAAAGSDRLQLQ